jgi:hypothetical protein
VYGLPGALIALPLAAATRATWEFFSERVARERWVVGGAVPILEDGTALLPPLVVEKPPRRDDPDPPAAAAG